jgi:HEAT repeat protein
MEVDMNPQMSDGDDLSRRLEKLEKTQADYERKLSRLETFKALSTFISSVVLAAAGIIVTLAFNSKELKVSQEQATAQMTVSKEQSNAQITIARNKELAAIIPNLGAADANTRKVAAISLALYGKDATRVLVAALPDERKEVGEAAETSLIIIGDAASEELIKVFDDERTDEYTKGRSLYVLSSIKNPQALTRARLALKDLGNQFLCKNAVQVVENWKDKQSANDLIGMLKKRNYLDAELTRYIVRALGEIGDQTAEEDFRKLLNDPDESVRVATVWAYAKVAGERAVEILNEVKKKDKSENVKNEVDKAINTYARGNT